MMKPFSERRNVSVIEGIKFTIPPVITEAGCWLAPNAGTAHSRRVRILGTIPDGKFPDVTCGDPLCSAPAHCIVRDKLPPLDTGYPAIREMIRNTPIGEFFDVDVPPQVNLTTSYGRSKFRAGLGMMSPHFIMRILSRNRIRIIRDGDWNDGNVNEWRKKYPTPTAKKVAEWKRPAVIWLGMLAFADHKVPADAVGHKCQVRECCFPVMNGAGDYCRQHNHWFDFPISMHDTTLDKRRLFKTWEPLWQTDYDLAAEFPVSTANLELSLVVETAKRRHTGEKYTAKSTAHRNAADELNPRTITEQPFKRPRRSVIENRNGKSWQKWIDKAGQLVNFIPESERTDGAIYEAVVESASRSWQLTDEYLAQAARDVAAAAKALNHVTVTREVQLQYVPEKRVPNYQGRGTRGGHPGSHKKIRKKQRMRPAGWHGSRPDHDVEKRWSRETIEDIERVEDYGNDIDLNTLHDTGWYE
jgi:hypothetical protein